MDFLPDGVLSLMIVSGMLALAWLSPGPNMIAVIDASLKGGRRAGFATGLGIATGNMVWSALAIAGLDVVFRKLPEAMIAVQLLGSAYLLYLAVKLLRAAIKPKTDRGIVTAGNCGGSHYATGLMVIFTNPKAVLFFASIFSTFIPTEAPAIWKLSVIFLSGAIPAVGHSLTSTLLSRPVIVRKYLSAQRQISVTFATVFFFFALKIIANIFAT